MCGCRGSKSSAPPTTSGDLDAAAAPTPGMPRFRVVSKTEFVEDETTGNPVPVVLSDGHVDYRSASLRASELGGRVRTIPAS